MNKQELARRRNWLKMRILGFNIRSYRDVLTDIEKERLKQWSLILQNLLIHWDDNTKELGLKTNGRTRCDLCLKRRLCEYNICRECMQRINKETV